MTTPTTAASLLAGSVVGGGLFVEGLNASSKVEGLIDSGEPVGPRGVVESAILVLVIESATLVLIVGLAVVNTASV